MAPMYLGRWIVFYMDINDRVYAGTKEVEAKSSSIEPIVKKAQASVCNENLFPITRFVVIRNYLYVRFVVNQNHLL